MVPQTPKCHPPSFELKNNLLGQLNNISTTSTLLLMYRDLYDNKRMAPLASYRQLKKGGRAGARLSKIALFLLFNSEKTAKYYLDAFKSDESSANISSDEETAVIPVKLKIE